MSDDEYQQDFEDEQPQKPQPKAAAAAGKRHVSPAKAAPAKKGRKEEEDYENEEFENEDDDKPKPKAGGKQDTRGKKPVAEAPRKDIVVSKAEKEDVRGRNGYTTPQSGSKAEEGIRSRGHGSVSRSVETSLSTMCFTEKFSALIGETDDSGKGLRELKLDNGRLRAALKELNEELTRLVSRESGTKLAEVQAPTFFKRPRSQKLRTLEKELENYEQMLETKTEELERLRKRLARIGEPGYVPSLKERAEQLRAEFEEISRENRRLEVQAARDGKVLDVLETGEPETLQKANKVGKELALLQRKNAKAAEEIAKIDDLMAEGERREEEARAKLESLQSDPRAVGADEEAGPENPVVARAQTLRKKLKTLESGLELMKKKNAVFLDNQRSSVTENERKNAELEKKIREADTEIERLRTEVSELMEKESIGSERREFLVQLSERTNDVPTPVQQGKINATQSTPSLTPKEGKLLELAPAKPLQKRIAAEEEDERPKPRKQQDLVLPEEDPPARRRKEPELILSDEPINRRQAPKEEPVGRGTLKRELSNEFEEKSPLILPQKTVEQEEQTKLPARRRLNQGAQFE